MVLRTDPQPAPAADVAPAPGTKGALTRQAILGAAVERFGRDGFRATSVADIARDAGVGGTVAYSYFPNKEALFLAAVDTDVASLIAASVAGAGSPENELDWPSGVVDAALVEIDRHPLARRLLAGLEPEHTGRVLDIPALEELRAGWVQMLADGQHSGRVRRDIDPEAVGNGIISIVLSLLMSLVQLGADTVALYRDQVAAVFDAAVIPTWNTDCH